MSLQSMLSIVRRGERSMYLIIKKSGLEMLYNYNRTDDDPEDAETEPYPDKDDLESLVIMGGSIEDVYSVLRLNYADRPGEYAVFQLSDVLSVQVPPPSVADVKSVFVPLKKSKKKAKKSFSKISEDKLSESSLVVDSKNEG